MDKTKVPPVVSVDIKSLRWCGGLSGCIRTSATKANLNLLKQRDTFSSEEDDYDEEEVFDKVTEQINQFLDHAGSQDEEWSDKLASAAGAIFTSTSGSIETLSRDSKTVFNKLTATKFHDVASTAEDIFNVMGKAHWTAAGLLVVAAVIKNIQKLKRVDKECVELLRSLHTVGTSLNRLIHLQHRPPEMESNIDRSKKLISRGAALCLAVMYSSGVSKFFRSAGNESKISTCRRDLDRLQSEMSFQLNIATYSESHEPTGLWPHSHQSSSNNQGGKSEEQGKGDIHNQEQNTGEGRKSPERNPQKEILNSRSLQQRSGGRDEAQFAQFLQRRIRILPTPTDKNYKGKCKQAFNDYKLICRYQYQKLLYNNAGGWNLQRSPNFFITLTRLFGIGPGGERGKLESVDKKATTEESVEKHESQDTGFETNLLICVLRPFSVISGWPTADFLTA